MGTLNFWVAKFWDTKVIEYKHTKKQAAGLLEFSSFILFLRLEDMKKDDMQEQALLTQSH